MVDIKKIGDQVFELIWQNTNDAIFTIGQDGSILHANPTFTDILGWEIEEIGGITPPPFFVNMMKEQHMEFLNKLKDGENINYSVTKRRSKDGEILDILASYRVINKDDVLAVGMYKDFTEQMEIQRQLEASEDCYRSLVDFLPDAVIVQNKHHIVFVNPTGVNLLGKEHSSDIIGRSLWNFIFSEQKERIVQKLVEIMDRNESSKPTPIIEKFIRYDYKIFYVEITAIPIVYNGEPVVQILFRDITERKKYELQLESMAFHDPLTGLKNRRGFIEIMEQSIAVASKTGEKLALMYMDLDKFKGVNDTFGHEIGDELLKQFAKRLEDNMRDSSVHCRMGGDEFLVLINDIEKLDDVSRIAERLYNVLQEPYIINGHTLETTASIGISLYPQDGDTSRVLIKNADKALYMAKTNRNEFRFYGSVV
ncbi:diguanylate cyclase [Bacillus sp. JJ1521]|uniref:diguanylate cyclase domain-containing protein n=1 Tax=Bacillus sp. JJ1521 TaxID=3122957 RepID=UPI002FFF06EA